MFMVSSTIRKPASFGIMTRGNIPEQKIFTEAEMVQTPASK